MALFNIPELREWSKQNPRPTVAISHSDLGPGDATHILNEWAIELKNYATTLGYPIIDISGPDLVYERMTQILAVTKPAVLFNFSHGCANFLVGNDGKCVLTNGFSDMQGCGMCGKGSNLQVLKGVAVVAYSCHSGAQLAKCAIKYGSPLYIGFSDNLIVVSDAYRMQDVFKTGLMPMAYHILEGWSAGEAVKQTQEDLYNLVRLYKVVELLSVPLWYNKKYLTQLGDPNWRLV